MKNSQVKCVTTYYHKNNIVHKKTYYHKNGDIDFDMEIINMDGSGYYMKKYLYDKNNNLAQIVSTDGVCNIETHYDEKNLTLTTKKSGCIENRCVSCKQLTTIQKFNEYRKVISIETYEGENENREIEEMVYDDLNRNIFKLKNKFNNDGRIISTIATEIEYVGTTNKIKSLVEIDTETKEIIYKSQYMDNIKGYKESILNDEGAYDEKYIYYNDEDYVTEIYDITHNNKNASYTFHIENGRVIREPINVDQYNGLLYEVCEYYDEGREYK